jgi:hypothetical protein
MKYVICDAAIFHHDLPFIPHHYTYAPFTSSPQFTSFHFIAFLDDFPHTFASPYFKCDLSLLL